MRAWIRKGHYGFFPYSHDYLMEGVFLPITFLTVLTSSILKRQYHISPQLRDAIWENLSFGVFPDLLTPLGSLSKKMVSCRM